MPCHFPAALPIKRNSKNLASLLKLIQDYSTIQSEISEDIDKAFLMNLSGLREKLRRILFLSLLQQTHIKTIMLLGKKDSGRSSATRSSATRCRITTSPSKPTSSSSSTEVTSWLNVKPFPVTAPKPIAHTSHGSSSNPLRGSGECKRGRSLRKRTKS